MRQQFRMSVGAEPGEVEKVNKVFARFAETNGLPGGVRRSVNVALDELLANDLSHGMSERENGSVTVEVALDRKRVIITITDDGPPFDPFKQATPDTTLSIEERSIGGLGIHLVRELMDDFTYERRDGHNIVVLVKQLVG
jgi:anti-sigma regulatory factor (Ser/Thr protein kinase)